MAGAGFFTRRCYVRHILANGPAGASGKIGHIFISFNKFQSALRGWLLAKKYCFEGFWSLATNPLIIFLLGWLPLLLGGDAFRNTVLSRNLPVVTRDLMILSMCGLILSTIISLTLIPPPPPHLKIHHRLFMILQWILVPITIVVFGALPGLDAQTRLMTKRYLGFWVTPKHLK